MNDKVFFRNAALVFGLAASGAGYAQQTPQIPSQDRDAYRTRIHAENAYEQYLGCCIAPHTPSPPSPLRPISPNVHKEKE